MDGSECQIRDAISVFFVPVIRVARLIKLSLQASSDSLYQPQCNVGSSVDSCDLQVVEYPEVNLQPNSASWINWL